MSVTRRQFIDRGCLSVASALAGSMLWPSRSTRGASGESLGSRFRLVGTEEHFASPAYVEALRRLTHQGGGSADLDLWRRFFNSAGGQTLIGRLQDVGAGRLAAMDATHVDVQVLSLTSPGIQILPTASATSMAAAANDFLAETVARQPTRFVGLGSFAAQDPRSAAREIERGMKRLGFRGWVVNSNTHGEYLDDPKFWPIFEAAETLGAPIYLHPRNVPKVVSNAILRHGVNLNNALWGFQIETATHAVRLIIRGVFDRFPKLKIVLGHLGEGIPFWLYRMDYMASSDNAGRIRDKPSEYFKRNFMVSISGINDPATLEYCCRVLGSNNIMFATDYPFQETTAAVRLINESTLPEADLHRIAHENAEQLFGIPAAGLA